MASLKGRLTQDLGRTLHAKVEVVSLSLDAFKGELHAAGVTLTNERPDAPWDQGEISQATVHFHWRDLMSPTLPLTLEVSSWKVVLRPASSGTNGTISSVPAPDEELAASGASRHSVAVTELSAQQGEVEIDLSPGRQILLHDVAFDAVNNSAQVWTTQVHADSISAGTLQIGNSSVQLQSDADKIAFTDLRLACAAGIITGGGEIGLGAPHQTQLNLTAVDVPVTMLVAIEWQMKLSGLASGTLAYQGNDQGAEAHGQLSLAGGKFNLLPFISKLTVLVGLPDITGVEVDKAATDFEWKDRVLHLTNLDVRKNDVMRIAGEVQVDAGNQVDGHLKLGLPESALTHWPQLQTAIFPNASDDFGWTDVHLTGTPDHLQEDLSSRVLAVSVQSGSDLINQGAQKASSLLKSLFGP